MKKAIIGFSGFIGSNLRDKLKNFDEYNSENINKIRNKSYDEIYCCALDSRIWKVNSKYNEDLKNLFLILENLSYVKCKKFIHISSVEIYDGIVSNKFIDESTQPNLQEISHYGRNRYIFEKFIEIFFVNHLIIRLPVLYGNYLKKNIIYDLLNKRYKFIKPYEQLQFYPINFLIDDIKKIKNKEIKIINLASEPIMAWEICKIFNHKSKKKITKFDRIYNIKSKYFNKGYRLKKRELIRHLKNFYKNEIRDK